MPEAGKKQITVQQPKHERKSIIKKKSLNETGYDKTKNLKKVNK